MAFLKNSGSLSALYVGGGKIDMLVVNALTALFLGLTANDSRIIALDFEKQWILSDRSILLNLI